jgi:hypothetical protein
MPTDRNVDSTHGSAGKPTPRSERMSTVDTGPVTLEDQINQLPPGQKVGNRNWDDRISEND